MTTTPETKPRRHTLYWPALWLAVTFWFIYQLAQSGAPLGSYFFCAPFLTGSLFFLVNNWGINHGRIPRPPPK